MRTNVTYRKEAREYAKTHGMALVTLATPGMVLQCPATKEELALVTKCIIELSRMRFERLNKEAVPATDERGE